MENATGKENVVRFIANQIAVVGEEAAAEVVSLQMGATATPLKITHKTAPPRSPLPQAALTQ
jgi:hypothetical protein